MEECLYDVIIVGAGPAGLSAALILGRCRRRALIIDADRPRNAAARELHGFLTRDGISPQEFLRAGREQLRRYHNIEHRIGEVVEAARSENGFTVQLADGVRCVSRMLLLATGIVDDLPRIEGLVGFYGSSAFHCPYCDGWEVRDLPLAMYKPGGGGIDSTLELTVWSRDVVLCTDGPATLSQKDRQRLAQCSIPVREARIARLEGTEGQLERIVFADGSVLPRRALFFSTNYRQQSSLPERLGVTFSDVPLVETGRYEDTNVPGLFVAGDASREVQLAIVAAAEGAKAAFAINTALAAADVAADSGASDS